MTRAIVIKRMGAPVVLAAGSQLLTSMTAQAKRSRDDARSAAADAQTSASVAEAFSGPTFADTTAGLAGTSVGESFAVEDGGIVTVYLHEAGPVATEQRVMATTAALAASGGAEMLGSILSGTGASVRSQQEVNRDKPSVKGYGAAGDGVTADGVAFNDALTANPGGSVFIPKSTGDYIIDETIDVPDYTELVGPGWGVTLKRGFDGPMFKLGKQSKIRNFLVDGNKAAYPTSSNDTIVIEVGENTPTAADQGHQLISDMAFINTPGYPINYTVANKGWMSKVQSCVFEGTAADAAVKWPDDATTGGNRTVTLCYSDVAIVNAGGCDNGFICFNTTGGSATTNQGIVFPAGTTNRAKKIIVVGNRFAIATGSLNIRGLDHVFSGNVVAGDVVFESNGSSDGASGVAWDDSNAFTGALTDSSGSPNKLSFNTPKSFTPAITPASGSFSAGNADIRGEYTREDNYITAHYFITMGSTTTYGTGAWTISLPVNPFGGGTTDFVGSAMAQNQACIARTLFAVGSNGLQVLTSAGSAIGATTPSAWANTNVLMISIRYRIF